MNNVRAMALGLILAAGTIVVCVLLPYKMKADLLAILLAAIGAVYVGFALNEEDTRNIKTEIIAASAFIAIAILGNWISIKIIGLGYVAHAIWDVIHHPRAIKTKTPDYYVGLCFGYDIIVGIYALSIRMPSGNFL